MSPVSCARTFVWMSPTWEGSETDHILITDS